MATELERQEIVTAFCQECVWARAVRTHFAQLFESGELRHRLLAESASTFFQDLNLLLMEYVLLQQCKLTDPPSSGVDKDNLTTNHVLGLGWTAETEGLLRTANTELMSFRSQIVDARRKLVAHSDLRAHLQRTALGKFREGEEQRFWDALQSFANAAHLEALGEPFEIDATMPDGDAASLIHRLVEAADYDDLIKEGERVLVQRLAARRYRDA